MKIAQLAKCVEKAETFIANLNTSDEFELKNFELSRAEKVPSQAELGTSILELKPS